MPEEIQIMDPDGTESASTGSAGQAEQPTTDMTMRALSAVEAERLSLEQLEAREARYGTRKPMGPPLIDEPEGAGEAMLAGGAAVTEDVEAMDPMEVEGGE